MTKSNKNQGNRNLRPLVVSVRTAAQLLDMSEKTVRRWIEKGILKPMRVDKLLRIPLSQIQALINGESQESSKGQG